MFLLLVFSFWVKTRVEALQKSRLFKGFVGLSLRPTLRRTAGVVPYLLKVAAPPTSSSSPAVAALPPNSSSHSNSITNNTLFTSTKFTFRKTLSPSTSFPLLLLVAFAVAVVVGFGVRNY